MHPTSAAFRFSLKFSIGVFVILSLWLLYLDWRLVVPGWLKYGLLLINLVTLFGYWRDKKAAEQQAWRTQESTLLLLGLAGGWPAAFVAQHWFRHKNRKVSFQLLFWLTVLINTAACYSLWISGWLLP
ncbi:DUF1294 domain-containing protein [Rheinheimera sp.]|jgi:uncharacterized membrane protein YsdA (DUF1294 family)|uniref:DUF1294 domain-containing protein n=1 Tax=Rheinheimera sp. TaxID=1869214 RepID=UPI0026331D93|nr:DUF1294 domain-containing protein [Rheinheimera sp.]MCA1931322.1 DUF1294 domain-containing protein [Rheinheimera sp.]